MKRVEQRASFGGVQEVWEHDSKALSCTMRFAVFLPPGVSDSNKAPVLYWLSGLTCTEQNFITKAGAQKFAAEHGIILVAPDTSPRGDDVADDEHWDMGKGAGFYLNATESPWSSHYRMDDYVRDELPALVEANFPANDKRSIAGHSMGGHGALVLALRNPGRYKSVSAFAPIVGPCDVPWGKKAFSKYLGSDEERWKQYDACHLVSTASEKLELLIDQGDADGFLEEQLQPQRLARACELASHPMTLRMQPGYDHSFYFIASFIEDHIRHHARFLVG